MAAQSTARVCLDLAGDRGQFLGARVGSEDDSVAAGPFHRLDDQFGDAVEDLLALLVQPTAERVDVLQERLLTEVVVDDLRNVGIDEFVVTDSVADGARDHHVARPRRIQ